MAAKNGQQRIKDLTAIIDQAMELARSAGEHDVETLLEAALETLLLNPVPVASWDAGDFAVARVAARDAED